MIDSAGNVMDKYYYYSFGESQGEEVSTNQSYRYTSKPLDMEGGIDIYYYGARYYDPELGRFMSIDPAASKYPGWSPYVYTLNNPLKNIDPDGRVVETVLDVGAVGLSAYDFYEDPSWSNAGWLTLDALAVAIPFVPAVGIIRHGGKLKQAVKWLGKADDAKDAVKATDKAIDVGKAAKQVHGNTAGNQPATLYGLYDEIGNFQKWGVTGNMKKRYTKKQLAKGELRREAKGPRKKMLKKERNLVEKEPGPLNKEPWAGKRQ